MTRILIYLLVIAYLGCGTSLKSQVDTTVELLDVFSELNIQESDQIQSIESFSEQFTDTLGLNHSKLIEFGLKNSTHLTLKICLTPEKTATFKLFEMSSSLRKTLNFSGNQSLSYNDLIPIRKILSSAQNEHPFSSHVFTPAQNIELRNLNKKISIYENIANIFQFASPNQNLTKETTLLLSSFPLGREAYQNQLDGMPYDSTLVEKFQTQLEVLKKAKPSYSIIPNHLNELTTLEAVLLQNSDGRLFPQIPMLFVQMFDSYRENNLSETIDIITHINRLSENIIPSNSDEQKSTHALISWGTLVVALLGFIVSLLLAITALIGSKKALILSLATLSSAWALHYLWMFTRSYPTHTFFEANQFIATTGLFIMPLIWLRRKEWIIAFAFISTGIVLFQHIAPPPTSAPIFWLYAPVNLKIGYVLYLSISTLAIVTTLIISISTTIIVWKHRSTIHDRHTLRTLIKNSRPLIHILNIFNLFALFLKSTEAFISVSTEPIWNSHFFSHIAMISICALILQMRWINKLSAILLIRMTWLLVSLGIMMLLNLPESLSQYIPRDDLSSTHALPALILLAGTIGFTMSYLPNLIRIAKSFQETHNKKSNPTS